MPGMLSCKVILPVQSGTRQSCGFSWLWVWAHYLTLVSIPGTVANSDTFILIDTYSIDVYEIDDKQGARNPHANSHWFIAHLYMGLPFNTAIKTSKEVSSKRRFQGQLLSLTICALSKVQARRPIHIGSLSFLLWSHLVILRLLRLRSSKSLSLRWTWISN